MNIDGVLRYLKESYDPHTIITFGSFAMGTFSPESDFDVVVISDTAKLGTDTSEVDGILLDAFIYNTRDVLENMPTELLQLYDSRILLDEKGYGSWLIGNVRQYVRGRQRKNRDEKAYLRSRMRKLLRHAEQGGDTGRHRLYWILKDSPEAYCSLRDAIYYGPDEAMKWLEKNSPGDYAVYHQALVSPSLENVRRWVEVLLGPEPRR